MAGCGWDRSGVCTRLRVILVDVLRRALVMIGNRWMFVVEAWRNRVNRWSINIVCKDKGGRCVREEGNRAIGVMCCVLEGRDGRKKGAKKGSY